MNRYEIRSQIGASGMGEVVNKGKRSSLNFNAAGAKPKVAARQTSAAKRAERMNVFDGTQPGRNCRTFSLARREPSRSRWGRV
jgi:hypothetical protein